MPLTTTAAAKQLSDFNSQGTVLGGSGVNPVTGLADKISFFGAAPALQPTAGGLVTTVAAGSVTSVFVNTTFSGAIGTTAYTVTDIVAALKTLGLIKS